MVEYEPVAVPVITESEASGSGADPQPTKVIPSSEGVHRGQLGLARSPVDLLLVLVYTKRNPIRGS